MPDSDFSHRDHLFDRGSGCLAGVAAGDSLGGPFEGLSSAETSGRPGSSSGTAGEANPHLEPGETSDDTAMTLSLAESIAAQGGLDPDDAARRFADWYSSGPRGIGAHTSAVLEKIAAGEEWEQASLKVQAASPSSAGNGSLMRCAPVALLYYSSPAQLIEASRLSSRITHPHGECQWSCAFMNLVIGEIFGGSKPRHAVDSALALCAHRGDVNRSVLERAARAAKEPGGADLIPSGYVLDTLECSLWSLLHTASFEQAVSAAVGMGGDADTIGAVTGALAGAVYGFGSIPESWLSRLEAVSHLRQLAADIIDLT